MLENDMESKRHQKLLEHYKVVLKDEPAFSLKLKKNVLPTGMKPITTLAFKPTEDMPFGKLCTIGASDYLMPERENECKTIDFYLTPLSSEVSQMRISDKINEMEENGWRNTRT